jgi:hypothetical protein
MIAWLFLTSHLTARILISVVTFAIAPRAGK